MKDRLDSHDLATIYDTFVTVDRYEHRLYVHKRTTPTATNFRRIKRFIVAVGAEKYETPVGPHFVFAKTDHPDWLVPNSQWAIDAGLTVGEVIRFDDPRNPIKEAFLRITDDGVGIHGTDNMSSLGKNASHGCIRVSPAAAKWLYAHIPVGTPVFITR